jgi:hypothetical protein
MRTEARRWLQGLRRARNFLAVAKVDPASGSVRAQVEALGGAIDRAEAHAVVQSETGVAYRLLASQARDLERTIRREYLAPVSKLGKVLFPRDIGTRRSLLMPRHRDREGLVNASITLAGLAEQHKEAFTAAGFAADFADKLRELANRARTVTGEKDTQYGRRAAATAGIEDEVRRGRDILRLLDAMVLPSLEVAPDSLAEWRTLVRFVHLSEVPVTPAPKSPEAPVPSTPEAHAA